MTDEEIEYRLAEIRANFTFEGMYLNEEDEQDIRDVLSGKVNADDLIAKSVQEWRDGTRKYSPPDPHSLELVKEILGYTLPKLYSLQHKCALPEAESISKRMIGVKNILLRPTCTPADRESAKQAIQKVNRLIEREAQEYD